MNFVGEAPESDEEPVADSESDEEPDEDSEDDGDEEEDEDDDDEDEVVDSQRFLFLSTARELSTVNVWKVLEHHT